MIDNVFTYEKYEKLGEPKLSNIWYKETYNLFTNDSPVKNKDDVLKMIAYAYSWMPTIPDIRELEDSDWFDIIAEINQLRNDQEFVGREKLLAKLVPIINNSIVGTSKVLHFIAPNKAPIFDSRVIKNWNQIFSGTEVALGHLKTKSEQQIQQYTRYWDYMHTWLKVIHIDKRDVTLRDLELRIFEFHIE
jgi:hypothetical protein